MDNDFTILGDWFLRTLKDEDEEKTCFFKDMKENEEKLLNMLSGNELKLFKSFRYNQHEHLYQLQYINVSKAINTGIFIGLQLYPFLHPELWD